LSRHPPSPNGGNNRLGAPARHAYADRLNGRYETLYESPGCATRAVLPYVMPLLTTGRVWEPCAGRGAILRELKAAGVRVTASDIHAYRRADPGIRTPVDFFEQRRAPANVDVIFTNPPYMHGDQFIRHALTLVPTVIVLLRHAAQEGVARSDIIDRHLRQVFLGKERLPTMHREGWKGPTRQNAGTAFSWYVFRARPHAPSTGYRTIRISWRDA
jgi:hypothetical protein